MKKLLAVFLALTLSLLPALSLAENILGNAVAQDKAITGTTTMSFLSDTLTGTPEIDNAIIDLFKALKVDYYAQQGQAGLSLKLDGTEVLDADVALDQGTLYVRSSWVGEDTLAFDMNQAVSAQAGGLQISFDQKAAQELFSGDITELFPNTLPAVMNIMGKMQPEACDEAPYTQKIVIDLTAEELNGLISAVLTDLSGIGEKISLKLGGEDGAAKLAEAAKQELLKDFTFNEPLTVWADQYGQNIRIACDYTQGAEEKTNVRVDCQITNDEKGLHVYNVTATEANGERKVQWADLTVEPGQEGAAALLQIGTGEGEAAKTETTAELQFTHSVDQTEKTDDYIFGLKVQNAADAETGKENNFWITAVVSKAQDENDVEVYIETGSEPDTPTATIQLKAEWEVEGSQTEFEAVLNIKAGSVNLWVEDETEFDTEKLTGKSETRIGTSEDNIVFKANDVITPAEKMPSIVSDSAVRLLELPAEQQQEWGEAIAESAQMGLIKLLQSLPESVLQVVQLLMGGSGN